jgi:hypothetical protein
MMDEVENEEGAIDVCIDVEGCFVLLEQGSDRIAIMTRDQAMSLAESLVMLVNELGTEEAD